MGYYAILDSLQEKSRWEERMVSTTHGVWIASTQRMGVDVVPDQSCSICVSLWFGVKDLTHPAAVHTTVHNPSQDQVTSSITLKSAVVVGCS